MQSMIRQAEKGDLAEILSLYSQPDMDDGEELSFPEAEAIFERMHCYPDYRVFVAVCDGKIVGTFALAILDNLAHRGARSGLMEDVVVKAEWQGRGIGKQMVRFALDRCRERGCYKLALSSNLKREKAHRFYESLGFQKHGYSFQITLEQE